MIFDRMEEIQEELFAQIRHVRETKGREYATDEDTLADFKEVAEAAGISPLQCWLTYVEKHQRAIATYVREGGVKSESIEDRIKDVVTYHILLLGLVEDAAPKDPPSHFSKMGPTDAASENASAEAREPVGCLRVEDMAGHASAFPMFPLPQMDIRVRPTPWDLLTEYRGRIVNVKMLTEINHRLREFGWRGHVVTPDGNVLQYVEDDQ